MASYEVQVNGSFHHNYLCVQGSMLVALRDKSKTTHSPLYAVKLLSYTIVILIPRKKTSSSPQTSLLNAKATGAG